MAIYKILSVFIYIFFLPIFLITACLLIFTSLLYFPLFYKIDKICCRIIMFALFVWPRVCGTFPKDGTYIIMMNHSSFLDVFIFPLIPKGPYSGITAKGNFKIPIFSTLIRRIKAIPIERKNLSSAIESIKKAEEVLGRGIHIGILPEGTRTLDGNIGPMKKGGFHMAINTGTPIIPVGVVGAFSFKPKNRWWIQPGSIKINIGTAIKPCADNKQDIDGLMRQVEQELITLSGVANGIK